MTYALNIKTKINDINSNDYFTQRVDILIQHDLLTNLILGTEVIPLTITVTSKLLAAF